jgi:hypothetical protein
MRLDRSDHDTLWLFAPQFTEVAFIDLDNTPKQRLHGREMISKPFIPALYSGVANACEQASCIGRFLFLPAIQEQEELSWC